MRLGLKMILAMVAAAVVASIIPAESKAIATFLSNGKDIFFQLGRYLVYPFFFFNLAIAVGLLKRTHRLGRIFLQTTAIVAGATLILSILGALVAAFLPLSRIPIAFEQEVIPPVQMDMSLIETIFPANAFTLFGNLSFLPLTIMAFLLGLNFAFDREVAEPTYNLFDSLGRIFYRIVSLYVRILALPTFFFTADMIYTLRNQKELDIYAGFLILAAGAVFLIGFIIYGIISHRLCGHKGILNWLKGVGPSALFAPVSPDFMLSSATLSVTSHENQGLKREFGAFVVPLFSLFGRSGTAFLTSASMILILKSFTSLDITFVQIVQAVFYSFIASFMVSSHPAKAFSSTLALACLMYGQSIESGSAIMEPILPLLNHFSQLFDLFTLVLISKVIAYREGFQKYKKNRKIL